MPFGVSSVAQRVVAGALAGLALGASAACATPYLVVDADSGQVLLEQDATEVWYPASLTKLMTVYVALDAVRAGRLTMDTPLGRLGARGAHAAVQDGLPARHRGDARQRAQDADGEVAERHRRDRRRRRFGLGRGVRRRDERGRRTSSGCTNRISSTRTGCTTRATCPRRATWR